MDADELKDRLQSLAYDDWNQGVSTSWADAYRECADMVDEQPTIEARKKGEWIKKKSMIYCSCCACSFDSVFTNDFDYCPNCGADMREEGEQE